MKLSFCVLSISLAVAASLLGGCINRPSEVVTARETDLFGRKVKPVLEYYCIECHTDKAAHLYGGFSMETGRSAMKTGRHAPVILPGRPDESLLYHVLVLGHENVLSMPPAPDKMLHEELSAVRQWILSGAIWPDGEEGQLKLPH